MAVTATTGTTLTFEAAQNLLVKYGYAKKDMRTSDIMVAMFKQEDFDVSVEGAGETAVFYIAEDYAIKSFKKPIHIHTTANTSSPYVIGGVDLNALMTNYQKEKFDLDLWCYLANTRADNTADFDLDAFVDAHYPAKTDIEVAMMFDQLVLLGYLVEEEDGLEFYTDKQTTDYRAKKHPGVRYTKVNKG